MLRKWKNQSIGDHKKTARTALLLSLLATICQKGFSLYHIPKALLSEIPVCNLAIFVCSLCDMLVKGNLCLAPSIALWFYALIVQRGKEHRLDETSLTGKKRQKLGKFLWLFLLLFAPEALGKFEPKEATKKKLGELYEICMNRFAKIVFTYICIWIITQAMNGNGKASKQHPGFTL